MISFKFMVEVHNTKQDLSSSLVERVRLDFAGSP